MTSLAALGSAGSDSRLTTKPRRARRRGFDFAAVQWQGDSTRSDAPTASASNPGALRVIYGIGKSPRTITMEDPIHKLQEAAAATRYPLDAFHFVRRGLDYAVQMIHQQTEPSQEQDRHVSGQQLLEGIRLFAVQEYGRMTRVMLRRWNIHRTEDIGQIVFAMVNAGVMYATDRDSIRDFEDGYDFDTAFDVPIEVEGVPLEDAKQDIVKHG
jgi:uncharacterized repeat protein (TIGR04138 family)